MKHWTYYRLVEGHSCRTINKRLLDFFMDNEIKDAKDYIDSLVNQIIKLFKNKT